MKTHIRKYLAAICGLAIALACGSLFAHENLIIIPLFEDSGSSPPPPPPTGGTLANTVYVAKADAPYNDLHTALNSITNASASKPYTIFIAPGDYWLESTLQLKPYVHIVGSGKYATRLNASISGSAVERSSAMISGADYASVSNLTLTNVSEDSTANGNNTIGIYNLDTSIQIHDIDIYVSGANYAYGVFNNYSPSSTMRHVDILVEALSVAYGIFSSESSAAMLDINVASMGASAGYGLYLSTNASDTFDGGSLEGSSYSLVIFSSLAAGARILNTQIVWGTVYDAKTLSTDQCSFTYDESLSSVEC